MNTEEFMEMRLRGGLPRANAVKYVAEKHDVNLLSCVCAIDRAVLPPLLKYWVPGVEVSGDKLVFDAHASGARAGSRKERGDLPTYLFGIHDALL